MKKLEPISGVDLVGKLVVLKSKHYKGDERERTFKCEAGFGCDPKCIGSAVIGYFVADGMKCRVERFEIEGLAAPSKEEN
jgi:hypothetical protein